MQVLHLTAHLGGGVGKALSGLIIQEKLSGLDVQHRVICLEKPIKRQFVDRIQQYGGEITICPNRYELEKLIKTTDIVQLEWWNHPATIKYLCSLANIPLRLLTWCHVSGLFTPIIPLKLLSHSHKFLFTSPCSFAAQEVKNLTPATKNNLDVVPSSGGFAGLPAVSKQAGESLSVGYLGSLNFAKLHPRYVDFLAAVEIPDFKVRMIGETSNQEVLTKQCENQEKAGMLIFRGYREDIAAELATINVLAYLLNPKHYGTNENALLEAMAMGIVPIVLDNPAECQIVTDLKTGLIVRSPSEFAAAIQWLFDNHDERRRLGRQAAKAVRERFAVEKVAVSLHTHYHNILPTEKRKIDFMDIFGDHPAEWFLSCQENKSVFVEDGGIDIRDQSALNHGMFEKNKGSVFHFSRYFPDDKILKRWAKNLKLSQLPQ